MIRYGYQWIKDVNQDRIAVVLIVVGTLKTLEAADRFCECAQCRRRRCPGESADVVDRRQLPDDMSPYLQNRRIAADTSVSLDKFRRDAVPMFNFAV